MHYHGVLKRTTRAIYELWRSMHVVQLTVVALHQNILADFSRPVGVVGLFVQDDASGTGFLKFMHG
jgi:hypothetical protein